jgi:hypothetical protein
LTVESLHEMNTYSPMYRYRPSVIVLAGVVLLSIGAMVLLMVMNGLKGCSIVELTGIFGG